MVNRFTGVPAPLAQVAAMGTAAVLGGMAIAGTPGTALDPSGAWAAGLACALAWLASAFGLGRALRFALFPSMDRNHPAHVGLTLGLGIAALLFADAALGTVGAFGRAIRSA